MVSFSKMFMIGCADNSCVWGRGPHGVGTNGGCRCRVFKDMLTADRVQATSGIRLLRQLAELPELKKAIELLVETNQRTREEFADRL